MACKLTSPNLPRGRPKRKGKFQENEMKSQRSSTIHKTKPRPISSRKNLQAIKMSKMKLGSYTALSAGVLAVREKEARVSTSKSRK